MQRRVPGEGGRQRGGSAEARRLAARSPADAAVFELHQAPDAVDGLHARRAQEVRVNVELSHVVDNDRTVLRKGEGVCGCCERLRQCGYTEFEEQAV